MPRSHTVRVGECLLSLADRYGFADWKKLYDDEANEALRRQRPDPPLLAPGDVVIIPDLVVKTEPLPAATPNKLRVLRPKAEVKLVIDLHEGTQVEVVLGLQNAGGHVDKKTPLGATIAPDLREGTCTIAFSDQLGERPLELRLAVGELHDVQSCWGLQARLSNLGFYFGPVDGRDSRRTQAAIARFQAVAKLPVTGEADNETLNALRRAHDEP